VKRLTFNASVLLFREQAFSDDHRLGAPMPLPRALPRIPVETIRFQHCPNVVRWLVWKQYLRSVGFDVVHKANAFSLSRFLWSGQSRLSRSVRRGLSATRKSIDFVRFQALTREDLILNTGRNRVIEHALGRFLDHRVQLRIKLRFGSQMEISEIFRMLL